MVMMPQCWGRLARQGGGREVAQEENKEEVDSVLELMTLYLDVSTGGVNLALDLARCRNS